MVNLILVERYKKAIEKLRHTTIGNFTVSEVNFILKHIDDVDNVIKFEIEGHSGYLDVVKMIEELEIKGFAYNVNGNVFYDVSRFGKYGKLSGKNIND